MNKLFYLFLFICLNITALHSQTPTASFADWKDNKKAAYTIIHDDYSGSLTSIFRNADTIATKRGIKFCFGAITNQCGTPEWKNARTMMSHGHECVNHSHNHLCGGPTSSCTGVGTYGPAQFPTELGLSTQLIESNTGVRPRFFIHPYDEYTPQVISYLKNLGYIGTRAGEHGVINLPTFTDFMHVNFSAWGLTSTLADLNEMVDLAIADGGYTMNEFHGISDSSFAPIPMATYISHLNYVKAHINKGNIWSATASEAITYKMQRDAFKPVISFSASTGTINVDFTKIQTIDPSVLKTSVTLNVNLNGLSGTFSVTQNGVTLPFVKTGNTLTINVYPHKGRVTVRGVTGGNNLSCLQASYFNNATLSGSPVAVQYESSINYNWGTSAPIVKGIQADNFSVRWNGSFTAPKTGIYQFIVKADDGVRLWINNSLIINQWKDQSATSYTSSLQLVQGVTYTIKMEYYERTGNALAQLSWVIPTQTSQIMPFSSNCALLASVQSNDIITLDGRLDNNQAALQWVINTQKSIDYYQIEKRNEQGEFIPLSIVNDDNQSTLRLYDFVDTELMEGDNVYRIQTNFTDNNIPPQYSEVLKINYLKSNGYNIFPNPAQDNVLIDLSEAVGKQVDMRIFSIVGKELYREEIQSATTTPHVINLNSFEIGQYMIQINVTGQRPVTRKLVIGY